MAELTNAMKGVIQSSTARTSSTYASTDLIQLYDSNNAPTIKISKDDLMAAVKASLPFLLSDQGTSGTTFPSIASGVLGYMTVANLASVLGGKGYKTISTGQDFNDLMSDIGGKYICASGSITTTLLNRPAGLIEAFAMWVIPPSTQIIITQWAALKMYKRTKDGATFNKWQLVQGTEVNYA